MRSFVIYETFVNFCLSFVQSLETEKSQLASEKQVLMEEQEEMQKNLKSSELLGSKKLDELEGTLSNMSSALLARNEEISTLRQEIESKNLDLLNRESCISTLTDSKTQDEESFVKLIATFLCLSLSVFSKKVL